MSDIPYMKLFVGDLMADTMELDNREFGAYMRIIFAMWQSKTGLIHMRKMKLVSRCGRDWGQVWREIMHFFDISDDQFVSQKRVTIERDKAALISSVRSTSGVRGNHAKSLKRNKVIDANANANATQARAYIKDHNQKSLTDTSYLPDSMTDCSAAASQSPPISDEIEPPPAPAPECAPACDAPAPECARAKPEEGESVKGDSSGGDEDDGQVALAVASFNRIAGQVGWPKVKTPLSKVRKSRLKARIRRAGGVLEWIAAIRRGSQSAFLTSGSGRNGWKASFDFFAQESSFDRLIEGNYDDNHRKPPEKYDAGTEGARGAGAAAGSRDQRRDGGPHRGLLAGFARASSGLDAHTDVSGDGADGPAHR